MCVDRLMDGAKRLLDYSAGDNKECGTLGHLTRRTCSVLIMNTWDLKVMQLTFSRVPDIQRAKLTPYLFYGHRGDGLLDGPHHRGSLLPF